MAGVPCLLVPLDAPVVVPDLTSPNHRAPRLAGVLLLFLGRSTTVPRGHQALRSLLTERSAVQDVALASLACVGTHHSTSRQLCPSAARRRPALVARGLREPARPGSGSRGSSSGPLAEPLAARPALPYARHICVPAWTRALQKCAQNRSTASSG